MREHLAAAVHCQDVSDLPAHVSGASLTNPLGEGGQAVTREFAIMWVEAAIRSYVRKECT